MTFSKYIATLAEKFDLEEVHTDWIKRNAALHVPRLMLTLWEVFPEWPVTAKLLNDEHFGVRVKVCRCPACEEERRLDDDVGVDPEFLCIEVRGRIVAAY